MNTKENTMTKTLTLEQLEQAEAKAAAAAQRAREEAQAVRERARQRRAEAEHQHDLALFEAWLDDRQALEDDIAAARQRLREALLADPVWSAFRDLVLAGHRQTTRTLEYQGVVGRVRGPEFAGFPVPHVEPPTWDMLARIVEDDATAQGRDEAAAREQARVDVGQAAADQEAGR